MAGHGQLQLTRALPRALREASGDKAVALKVLWASSVIGSSRGKEEGCVYVQRPLISTQNPAVNDHRETHHIRPSLTSIASHSNCLNISFAFLCFCSHLKRIGIRSLMRELNAARTFSGNSLLLTTKGKSFKVCIRWSPRVVIPRSSIDIDKWLFFMFDWIYHLILCGDAIAIFIHGMWRILTLMLPLLWILEGSLGKSRLLSKIPVSCFSWRNCKCVCIRNNLHANRHCKCKHWAQIMLEEEWIHGQNMFPMGWDDWPYIVGQLPGNKLSL